MNRHKNNPYRKAIRKYKKIRKQIKRFWDKKLTYKKRIRPLQRSIVHLLRGDIRFAFYRYNEKIAKFDIHTPKVLSISYPRSGSRWLRFIVEWLTGRPTHGTRLFTDIPVFLNVYPTKPHPLDHVDIKAPFVFYKTHRLGKELLDSQSCVLILRNYRENVPHNETVIDGMRAYCNLIVRYDAHKGRKILIYYEDLLTDPARQIRCIADFFEVDEKRYIAFMDRYDFLRSMSYQGKYGTKATAHKREKLGMEQYRQREELYEKVLAEARHESVLSYLERYRCRGKRAENNSTS